MRCISSIEGADSCKRIAEGFSNMLSGIGHIEALELEICAQEVIRWYRVFGVYAGRSPAETGQTGQTDIPMQHVRTLATILRAVGG